MKYFAIFALLAFAIGAGCTSTSTIDTSDTASVTTDEGTGDLSDDMVEPTDDAAADDAEDTGEDTTVDADADVDVDADTTVTVPALPTLEVSMTSENFAFSPSTITAKAGQDVVVTFASNAGSHTFVLDEVGVNATVSAGGSISFTAPSTPGSYIYYCSVGSHHELGMEGTLIVTP